MKIKTNKVAYDLNYANITRDFSFEKLLLTDEKDVMQAYSVSFPKYNILCTYIEKKNKEYNLYLMGRKNKVDFVSFKHDLMKDGVDLKTHDLSVKDFEQGQGYILVSLLLQLIACGRDKNEQIPYGNYYGHLLAERKPYTKSEANKLKNDITVNGDTVLFNRIQFTKESTIIVSVETWKPFMMNVDKKKKKLYSYKPVLELGPNYEYAVKVSWDRVNEEFEKWEKASASEVKEMEDDLFSRWYIKGTYLRNSKNWMPFVTLKAREGFVDKAIIYFKFMTDVKNKLSNYVVLTPQDEEMTPLQVKKKTAIETDRTEKLRAAIEGINTNGLTIIYQNLEQKKYANDIADTLLAFSQDILPIKADAIQINRKANPKTWNLQIVENKNSSLYKGADGKYNAEQDDYYIDTQVCIQHYVFEPDETEKNIKNKIRVILLELLIKDGVIKNHMASCFCPVKEVVVAQGFPYPNKTGEKDAGEFFVLTLAPNGDITYKNHFTNIFIGDTPLDDEIMDAWDNWKFNYKGKLTLWHPEGFIKIDDSKLCTILKSTERPFPDYEKIIEDFCWFLSPKNVMDIKTMLTYLNQFTESEKKYTKYKNVIEFLKDEFDFESEDTNFSVRKWKAILKEACKSSGVSLKPFSYFVEKQTDGKFVMILHMKVEKNNVYELDHLTKISYNETDTMYKYFVGLRNLGVIGDKKTIRTSLPIRYVEKDPSFTFEDYARLLDVSWVRAGTMESTVIPYPFKILNEYVQLERLNKRREELEKSRNK